MSKIIVDEIQKTGGVAFTVPDSDSDANKALVTDGNGTLGFSDVSLPSGTGTAGQYVTTDGNGALEYSDLPEITPSASGYVNAGKFSINLPHATTMLKNGVGTVTVGETTYYCNASGDSCSWTVPAGVTKAQFQIWGAGGNGVGCSASCCSFGAAGGSGEYTYVKMDVEAGQSYTLCAGGATTVGSCYNYCVCSGCNSFVCGSNTTCLLSCGGTSNYETLCGTVGSCLYPEAAQHNYARVYSKMTVCSASDNCTGSWFGQPAFRCMGMAVGGATSANFIENFAKVPSYIGGVQQCGSSICYMRYGTYWIADDHKVCCQSTGWNGYDLSGCCTDSCANWNKPGMGGVAPIYACYSSGPTYGGRGRSGKVLVTYK